MAVRRPYRRQNCEHRLEVMTEEEAREARRRNQPLCPELHARSAIVRT